MISSIPALVITDLIELDRGNKYLLTVSEKEFLYKHLSQLAQDEFNAWERISRLSLVLRVVRNCVKLWG